MDVSRDNGAACADLGLSSKFQFSRRQGAHVEDLKLGRGNGCRNLARQECPVAIADDRRVIEEQKYHSVSIADKSYTRMIELLSSPELQAVDRNIATAPVSPISIAFWPPLSIKCRV